MKAVTWHDEQALMPLHTFHDADWIVIELALKENDMMSMLTKESDIVADHNIIYFE